MSDPVTNVEIEDVLSSIRRLVSDGDKARTRDPAPIKADPDPAPMRREGSADTTESRPDKLVLTPALMVVGNDATFKHEDKTAPVVEDVAEYANTDDQDDGWVEELPDEPEAAEDDIIHHQEEGGAGETASDFEADKDDDAESHGGDDHPVETKETTVKEAFILTNADTPDAKEEDQSDDMVWGSVDEARKIGLAAVPKRDDAKPSLLKTTDRSGLIASIAELEAAVSKDAHDFEPDGSEVSDEMMGETIAWPGTAKRNTENAQDAEDADQPDDEEAVEFTHHDAGTDDVGPSGADERAVGDAVVETDSDVGDEYDDDDLDGLLDAGNVSLDEDALRALVSEIVRQELTGPMGERITRNVRKLVRREIYRILSSQEFD